jgi:ABC-type Fe2+-enterobactin transport system substrate-binding protein
MYLSQWDVVAMTIALVSMFALILTSATANARLTNERNYWRQWAMYSDEEKALLLADEEAYDNRTERN